MSKEDGGQAFPSPATEHNFFYEGMTLRDYFAAKAMQAIIPVVADKGIGIGVDYPEENSGMAKVAYAIADAMIEFRSSNH